MPKNTYWNNEGAHQTLYNKVSMLIPDSGEVTGASNKKLERLRKAANCYHDLFNNGLCNRAREFRSVFGFGGTWIAKERYPYCAQLEEKMDEIILAAAEEQGIEVTPVDLAIEDLRAYDACIGLEFGRTRYYKMCGIKTDIIIPVAY